MVVVAWISSSNNRGLHTTSVRVVFFSPTNDVNGVCWAEKHNLRDTSKRSKDWAKWKPQSWSSSPLRFAWLVMPILLQSTVQIEEYLSLGYLTCIKDIRSTPGVGLIFLVGSTIWVYHITFFQQRLIHYCFTILGTVTIICCGSFGPFPPRFLADQTLLLTRRPPVSPDCWCLYCSWRNHNWWRNTSSNISHRHDPTIDMDFI